MSQRIAVATSVLAMVASASSAFAAADGDPANAGPTTNTKPYQVEEIIVTAQKRSEKASDVGTTINVATGAQLQDLGVHDVSQLSAAVPGFTFGSGQSGAPIYSLRGISFNSSQLSAAPAVSVYVNEAAIPYSFMTAGAFLDVDHIEVLKGPQGTLFGENSTGGSINVIPVKPTAKFAAGTEFTVNNFGQIENDGHIGGAVTSTLNARFSYSTTQFGAWQQPYFDGASKNGSQDKGAARLLLDWKPSDRLTVSLNINGNFDRGQQQQPQPRLFTPQNPSAVNPALATYPIPTNAREADIFPGFSTRLHNELFQSVLRAEYSLNDQMKVISITNYVDAQTRVPIDLTGTGVPIATSTTFGNDHTVSQELRLEGTGFDKRWTYVIGGNFEDNHFLENNEQFLIDYSGLPPGSVLANPYKLEATDGGIFVNSDFKVLPNLTLTGGLRYTLSRETIEGCSRDGGNGILSSVIGTYANYFRSLEGLAATNAFTPGGCITLDSTGATPTYLPFTLSNAQNEHNLSWRGGVNYHFARDMMLYTIISRGYKAGVWSDTSIITSGAAVPVKQEELTSYEVGAKLAFFERKLTVDASYFYYDYANKQFATITPTIFGGAFILKNIPESKADGFDIDVVARPISGLTLRAGATLVHTQVGPFLGYNHATLQPEQYDGSAFSYAPSVSATYDVTYRMPLTSEINGVVGVNGSYTARTWADLGEASSTVIPHYMLVNLRAGLESWKGWRASVWVRNLTNKYYITSTNPGGDEQNMMAGLPRTYGMTLGYEF